MKISIAIAFILSLFTTSVAVFATNSTGDSVHLISTKAKNIFVFTINKKWQGAQMEVMAMNGECISCQKVTRRKMIINFRNVKPGTYTVRINKDDQAEEFKFIKN